MNENLVYSKTSIHVHKHNSLQQQTENSHVHRLIGELIEYSLSIPQNIVSYKKNTVVKHAMLWIMLENRLSGESQSQLHTVGLYVKYSE